MKNLISVIISIFSFQIGFAANITAIQNGNWTAAATWDLNRVPVDGDDITIPAGRTVMFNNTPYPQNNPPARPTFIIRISGTLDFSSPGNDKLYLDIGSKILIYPGGKIQTSSSSTEIISIYNGSLDNNVWTGSPSTINGPASATSTTIGFTNSLLPVKLESLSIIRTDRSQAKISWTTSSEINSAYFEIETINQSKNTWQPVAKINAATTSSNTIDYSYLVSLLQGENQFRLKMADKDESFTYSSVLKINNNDNDVTAYYDHRTKSVIVNNSTANPVTVSLYSLSGSLILSERSGSSISLQDTRTGVYILRVASGNVQTVQKIFVQ